MFLHLNATARIYTCCGVTVIKLLTKLIYTGRSPVRAKGPAGCGHSKIVRVHVRIELAIAAAD